MIDKDLLKRIHGLLAKDMLARLQAGGLEAKDWAAIAKFLKDNAVDLQSENIQDDNDLFGDLVRQAENTLPAEFRKPQ